MPSPNTLALAHTRDRASDCERTARRTLPERLRAETRDAHLAAERAFDLPRRLGDLGSYIETLATLLAFDRACAPALALAVSALPTVLHDGPERRRARLAADLRALGHTVPPARGAEGPMPSAHHPSAGLGVWYVLEGAALGGLVIAAEIRRRLPEAGSATRYFTGEGAGTARRWHTFQAALLAWEGADAMDADASVAAALDTFTALTRRLRDGR